LRETELLKASRIPATTPRKRRMASVLDAIMESVKIYLFAGKMMRNMGFPKLELGLSAMSKDDLTDSLAYNSLKIYILLL
jgi:hypothetical protein